MAHIVFATTLLLGSTAGETVLPSDRRHAVPVCGCAIVDPPSGERNDQRRNTRDNRPEHKREHRYLPETVRTPMAAYGANCREDERANSYGRGRAQRSPDRRIAESMMLVEKMTGEYRQTE